MTSTSPAMIAALRSSSSPWSSAGTFDSKSWNGAMPTPSFSSVPTNGVLSNSPLPAARTASYGADVDALEDRGEHEVGDRRVGLGEVGVDADHRDLAAGVADGRGSRLVDRAADGQEHVDVLVDEALRGVARGVVRLEATGEEAVGAVPAEDLRRRALLGVVVVDALLEAVHEDRDRREVHAAEGADDAGLRVVGGRVAGEERRLGRVEEDRLDVVGVGLAVEVVVGRVVDDDVARCRGWPWPTRRWPPRARSRP